MSDESSTNMGQKDGEAAAGAVDFDATSNFEELSQRSNLNVDELKRRFYERGERFWRSSAPTLTTMLGGLEFIRDTDATDSKKFIRKLKREKILKIEKPSVACDCACGIGRVTRDVLLNFFDVVDLVEMAPEFLAKAPEFVCGPVANNPKPENPETTEKEPSASLDSSQNGAAMESEAALDQSVSAESTSQVENAERSNLAEQSLSDVSSIELERNKSRLGRLICSPLQLVDLEAERYDLIWLQWAAGQLEDSDLVAFFKRSVKALKPGGCVVIKDNVIGSDAIEYDEQDGSYMRPLALWKSLLASANVRLLRFERVRVYPKSWHPVYYFVYRAQEDNLAE